MSFLNDLKVKGRFPPVELRIKPLQPRSGQPRALSKTIVIDKFISYQYTNNMLVPVNNFSYSFTAPGDEKTFLDYVLEGDLVSLYANDTLLESGIVDQIEIECDGDSGEKVTVSGRNLLGQLEDQSAVSIDTLPIYLKNIGVIPAIKKLIEGTRIPQAVIDSGAPSTTSLLATEAGETKLSAILRFLDPVNCLLWSNPDGRINVGKPNMGSIPLGKMMINKKKRKANVLSMRVVLAATGIPSRYTILNAAVEEKVQFALQKSQTFDNTAAGPARLYRNGHYVTKCITTSLPGGADAASGDAVTALASAAKAGTTLLSQTAFRQMAKDNFDEIQVTCVVAGHYNENGIPFAPDTVYNIEYDRAALNENMYLYSVEYQGSLERGQWTILNFCRLGTIVEGAKINA